MRVFRGILFALFLVAYVVVCPLTILHAFGYSLQPGASQPLVKTGLIYLSSTPSGATVYLGKRRYTQKTPTMISGLLPGQYPVRLTLKDFRPWEQTLPVVGEKATALENILLVPTQLAPEIRQTQPVGSLVALPDTRTLLVVTGPLLGNVSVYDWKDDRFWPLLSNRSAWWASKLIRIKTVADDNHALFHVDEDGQQRWLWVEVRRGETPVDDLTNLFIDVPEKLFWSSHVHRFLFALQQQWINRLDMAEHAVSPRWASDARGFGISGRNLYLLRGDGRISRVDREGKEEEFFGRVRLPNAGPFMRPSQFEIHAAGPNGLLLFGESGELLATRPPYQMAEREVIGLAWLARRQKALVWTKHQIGVLKLAEESFESERSEQALKLAWTAYAGRDIAQAAWVDEGQHVLVRDNNQLVLLDLETYGPMRAEALIETAPSDFVYVEEIGRVYYLEPGSRRLASLQVLQKRERLPLPVLEYRSLAEPEPERYP